MGSAPSWPALFAGRQLDRRCAKGGCPFQHSGILILCSQRARCGWVKVSAGLQYLSRIPPWPALHPHRQPLRDLYAEAATLAGGFVFCHLGGRLADLQSLVGFRQSCLAGERRGYDARIFCAARKRFEDAEYPGRSGVSGLRVSGAHRELSERFLLRVADESAISRADLHISVPRGLRHFLDLQPLWERHPARSREFVCPIGMARRFLCLSQFYCPPNRSPSGASAILDPPSFRVFFRSPWDLLLELSLCDFAEERNMNIAADSTQAAGLDARLPSRSAEFLEPRISEKQQFARPAIAISGMRVGSRRVTQLPRSPERP